MQLAKQIPEAWYWIEVYEKETIPQFNVEGKSRHFSDIRIDELKAFKLRHLNGIELVFYPSDDNWRPIHFYRAGKVFGGVKVWYEEENGNRVKKTKQEPSYNFRHVICGYQENKDGINFKVLFKLYPNGLIEQFRE